MKVEKLKEILMLHDEWLNENSGKKADLRGADLRGADLRGADLRDADLREADLREADLRSANLRGADLRDADLCNADLRNADLCSANLRGANLDFSCWPLWCGSLNVKLDKKQKRQLLYHFLAVAPEYRTPELLTEANQFHQVDKVPELKMPEKG